MSLFYINQSEGIKKTYQDFIKDLSMIINKSNFIYTKDTYEVFLRVVHAIINQYHVELLDGDFSKEELENIGIDFNKVLLVEPINSVKLNDLDHLLSIVLEGNLDFNLTLYTSGTTGRPKKVSQTIGALTRNVKVGDRFLEHVWGFAYNATHMAGLQVLFQALFNKNTIVDLFGSNFRSATRMINLYYITHISATATYYRNLLSIIKGNAFPSVQRVTFGGEKYDKSLEKEITKAFPNSRVRNIYASTEAGSLFSSSGDTFIIPENLLGKVKISNENELLLHKRLLGFNVNEEWYKTGDIVEIISNNSFKFISRENEMINVGGYKVNPHEVEEILTKLDFITDALVKSRENKITGNIITADVVVDSKLSEQEIKKLIKEELNIKLQPFKIPRIIKIVEKIDQSRTGKKVRV
jgi:acyl-coenzyme A synthetase/AMP-(fatty) acid ligase